MLKLTTDKQTDRQTDKQTGQKQYAPDHSIRGIKNNFHVVKFCVVKKYTLVNFH